MWTKDRALRQDFKQKFLALPIYLTLSSSYARLTSTIYELIPYLMSFTAEGKLHKKFDIQQIKDTFQKREFVIEFIDGNPMYPQFVNFQLIQDKVDMIEPFQEGQTIKVEFNLKGREWRSPQGEIKYFNSLDAWRIQPGGGDPGSSQSSGGSVQAGSVPPPPPPPEDAIDVSQSDDDDLPF
jgi:hypothetical protein